jgi:hypothetical protein
VTATGGRGDLDLTAPRVEHADGDDITVIPEAPRPNSRGRMRAILVGAIVVILAAAAITIALVGRSDDSSKLSSVSKVKPRATVTNHAPVVAKPPAKTRPHAPLVSVAPSTPATAVAVAPVSVPPVTPTAPAVVTPPVEPPSVLEWGSAPATLSLKAGARTTVTVTVKNPTAGTVTLGQPLTCAPSLQTAQGAPIGSGLCEAMAQVMSPHQTLTQQYTITAIDSGTGTALAPGGYVVRVENLFSIPLTVTAG